MKKFLTANFTMIKICFLFIFLSVLTAYGQNTDIPEKVKDALNKKYPEAEEVSWIKKADNYEAEFFYDDELKAALFDANGQWLETSTFISEDELPGEAIYDIDETYEEGFINEAMQVTDNSGVIYYKVSVYTDKATFYLKINSEGEIIETIEEINTGDDYDLEIDESEFDYNVE